MASNQMSRLVGKLSSLPAGMQQWAQTFLLGKVVPFLGTAGMQFEQVTPQRVVVSVANKRKVQNHIKGIHAAAMALLAETATGFVVGMNLPDDKLPLLKSMKINYVRRSSGDMRAVAELTPHQKKEAIARRGSRSSRWVEARKMAGTWRAISKSCPSEMTHSLRCAS